MSATEILLPQVGDGRTPPTNERLLFDCYTATREAAFLVETIWNKASEAGVVKAKDAKNPLTDLRVVLQKALAAAVELENRAARNGK